MRAVGLDIHRNFAEAAEIRDGVARQLGRFDLVRDKVIAFAKHLGREAEIVSRARATLVAPSRRSCPVSCPVAKTDPGCEVLWRAGSRAEEGRQSARNRRRLTGPGVT